MPDKPQVAQRATANRDSLPHGVPENGTSLMKLRNFPRILGLGPGGAALTTPAIAQGGPRRRAHRADRQRVHRRQGGGAALRHVLDFWLISQNPGEQRAVVLLRQPASLGTPAFGFPGGDRHGLRRRRSGGHQPYEAPNLTALKTIRVAVKRPTAAPVSRKPEPAAVGRSASDATPHRHSAARRPASRSNRDACRHGPHVQETGGARAVIARSLTVACSTQGIGRCRQLEWGIPPAFSGFIEGFAAKKFTAKKFTVLDCRPKTCSKAHPTRRPSCGAGFRRGGERADGSARRTGARGIYPIERRLHKRVARDQAPHLQRLIDHRQPQR